ncbi:hypothetical protein GA0004736_2798 [Curtobacterium sp. 9128]|uniref:sucrase ferredoxin n=1 Tax=Curtobacterium sp. 9128 TaxID=1793722 RepID=UPI0007D7287B|nr:sucrase ferredoxin [Curtobacterium sp. 9128]SBN63857.1 hypothetical protein GA0004736_2798 [Curtobacterium sp. 9128]
MTEWRRTGPADPRLPRSAGGPACSDRSRSRDEDLTATASPGRRWLLVEVAGAWGWNVWADSPALPPETGIALARRVQRAGMRILAIRRPGRSRGAGRWRWAVVDTGLATVRWGEADGPDELLSLPLDGSTGTPSDRPVFAVCAHGRHDECCAVRGRSVAAKLAEAFPEETWECSHLGGDRFAATTMLFPYGLNHGRVDELDPVAIAEASTRGIVVPDGFRGRSLYSHVEQAAVAAAAARSGDHRIDAFRPRGVRAPETLDHPAGWSVELDSDAGAVVVTLDRVHSVPTFSTCRATVAVEIPRFVVRDVATAG